MKKFLLIFAMLLCAGRLMAQTLTVTSGGNVIAQNAAVYIAANAIVTSGATPLTGATVSISGSFTAAQDVLSINGTTSGNDGSITYSYNATTGVLTLAGAESAANYQVTLRKVTYTNTAALPNTAERVITFSLNSALPFTGNGHYFEFVASTNILWTNATTAANLRTYFGLQGYLATITSLNENTFVFSKINAAGWLGGSDATSEGVWKWVSGPENGTQFWQGAVGGSAVGGNFTYWALTPGPQPDNAFVGGEHYLCFWEGDHWNDYANSAVGSIAGYVVEYGGMAGDPVLHISDNVTVGFAPLVRNLAATGTGIKWYDAATGGSLLPGTTVLVNGQHYYASQTINGIESSTRLNVTANVITVSAPATGTHTPSQTQIVWNWNTVTGATGYKWSTTNLYSSATDMGTAVTHTETGLTCNTLYYRYIWAYNGSGCVSEVTTIPQTTSACLSGDAIYQALSGSRASYAAAADNSLVKITSTEYETIVTSLSAIRTGYTGSLDNNWATNYTTNSTFSYNANGNPSTTTTFSASNWVVAFSFIPSLSPQGSFSCQLKYNLSNTLVDITSLYSGATIAVLDRHYFAIKKPSIQLPGSSSYISLYSSSGIGTNWSNGYFDYKTGNLSGAVSGWSTITNSGNAVPTIQVLQTSTKQW